MASSLVTGVAGFVGSHLAEKLIEKGDDVTGIDSFSDFYSKRIKLSNLANLRRSKRFRFVEGDINALDLARLVKSSEYVFHLAARAGVRPSWGKSFERYVADNVLATQRLLEACKRAPIRRLVYSSSSSVYGDAETLPTPETVLPRPVSPYGATKLTGEHLCLLYLRNFEVPSVILRYFTVYGPRQRPDMAFHRFIKAVSEGKEIEVYGDGSQSRDFTYVGDTVAATVLAAEGRKGRIYNVGTGQAVSVSEVITSLEVVMGKKARVVRGQPAPGDVKMTSADTSAIRRELGFRPSKPLKDGLAAQIEWQTRPSP